MGFISTAAAQSMICAIGRIHNGPKFVFCFRYAIPSYHHYNTGLLTYIEHMRNSLKWNLTKERSRGEALIQRPLAFPLYEAATHVK